MLTPGQTFSHYTILAQIGEGGMGLIYRARDERLHREVALKVLHPEAIGDPDRRRRFLQEARAASALTHPHIATVYEIDAADTASGPVDFIAMEYVQGGSLGDRIGRGLPVPEALRLAIEVADALAAAHGAGIVHRDLKPGNIMIAASGAAKVVDFGLAKLSDVHGQRTAEITVAATAAGVVVGTVAYMAPEQAEGAPVDGRADLFSFGSVLYEMLTGRRPFERESTIATLTAIATTAFRPLSDLRRDVPADLVRITARCLQRDPAARYASAAALRDDLQASLTRLSQPRPVRALVQHPGVLVPAVVFLILLGATGLWFAKRQARARQARTVALPEIERLTGNMEYLAALRLAEAHEPDLRDDPAFVRLWNLFSMPVTIETTPPGARLSMRSYAGGASDWQPLGVTPLANRRLPLDNVRFRLEKDGYETLEWTSAILAPTLRFTLEAAGGARAGMVGVMPGRVAVATSRAVDVDAYWIDRHEVTNRAFKRFVDEGGYRRPELWKHPMVSDGRTLSFEEAMARFRDTTGRPGPSTWEVGTFPTGRDEYPVSGVSWYEAAAYAEFAGKSLPTIHHWFKAAGLGRDAAFFSEIVAMSNFDAAGSIRVASLTGVSPYGAYDMAGNVKEWAYNDAGNGRRYTLGGGWGEPPYMFGHPDAHPPIARDAKLGFRCARYASAPAESLTAPVENFNRDFTRERPVSDEVFKAFAALYQYQRTPLAATVDAVDESSPNHRRERISIDAAYEKERVPLWLLLPRHATPPFQTLVYFPSGESLQSDTSENIARDWRIEFVLQSGRAVAHPIYRGTYERREAAPPQGVPGGLMLQQFNDLGRSIDYLETRPEIDRAKLAYYGSSYGAGRAAVMLALEPRLRAGVLLWGGFPPRQAPIAEPLNFAPRVTVPVLMVNGRNDFIFPVETSQVPLFTHLGTPNADKRHVLFDHGHIPPKNQETMKEVLDWLDRYLGPVRR